MCSKKGIKGIISATTKTFNEPHGPLKLETQLYRVTDGSFLRPENENVKRVERVFHVLGFGLVHCPPGDWTSAVIVAELDATRGYFGMYMYVEKESFNSSLFS